MHLRKTALQCRVLACLCVFCSFCLFYHIKLLRSWVDKHNEMYLIYSELLEKLGSATEVNNSSVFKRGRSSVRTE